MVLANQSMKIHTFLFTLFVLVFAYNVLAQHSVKFGIKGGLNVSNLNNYIGTGYKESRTGLNVGVLAEISLNKVFSIQPEVLYSTQGVKTDIFLFRPAYPGPGPIYNLSTAKGEYIFNYVQIPLLVKVSLFKNLAAEAGPSFNFLTKSEQKSEYQKLTKLGKDFEISGILGLSYKLNKSIFLSSRFFIGLSNVFQFDAINFENAKNYGFQIDIGFLF